MGDVLCSILYQSVLVENCPEEDILRLAHHLNYNSKSSKPMDDYSFLHPRNLLLLCETAICRRGQYEDNTLQIIKMVPEEFYGFKHLKYAFK